MTSHISFELSYNLLYILRRTLSFGLPPPLLPTLRQAKLAQMNIKVPTLTAYFLSSTAVTLYVICKKNPALRLRFKIANELAKN